MAYEMSPFRYVGQFVGHFVPDSPESGGIHTDEKKGIALIAIPFSYIFGRSGTSGNCIVAERTGIVHGFNILKTMLKKLMQFVKTLVMTRFSRFDQINEISD